LGEAVPREILFSALYLRDSGKEIREKRVGTLMEGSVLLCCGC
jgi:hypothetical protein